MDNDAAAPDGFPPTSSVHRHRVPIGDGRGSTAGALEHDMDMVLMLVDSSLPCPDHWRLPGLVTPRRQTAWQVSRAELARRIRG